MDELRIGQTWTSIMKHVYGYDVAITRSKYTRTSAPDGTFHIEISPPEFGINADLEEVYSFFHEVGHIRLNTFALDKMAFQKYSYDKQVMAIAANIIDDVMINLSLKHGYIGFLKFSDELTEKAIENLKATVPQTEAMMALKMLPPLAYAVYASEAAMADEASRPFLKGSTAGSYFYNIGRIINTFTMKSYRVGDKQNSYNIAARYFYMNGISHPFYLASYERDYFDLFEFLVKEMLNYMPQNAQGKSNGENGKEQDGAGEKQKKGMKQPSMCDNATLKEEDIDKIVKVIEKQNDKSSEGGKGVQKNDNTSVNILIEESVANMNELIPYFRESLKDVIRGKDRVYSDTGSAINISRYVKSRMSGETRIFRRNVNYSLHNTKWNFVIDVSGSVYSPFKIAELQTVFDYEMAVVRDILSLLPDDCQTKGQIFAGGYSDIIPFMSPKNMINNLIKVRLNIHKVNLGNTEWNKALLMDILNGEREGVQTVILTDGDIGVFDETKPLAIKMVKDSALKPVLLFFGGGSGKVDDFMIVQKLGLRPDIDYNAIFPNKVNPNLVKYLKSVFRRF
jgi:hypothetical protein